MSRYEYEEGTLKLPTAAVATVRKAVREEYNACVAEAHELCKRFWADRARRTRSAARYEEALEALRVDHYAEAGESPWVAVDPRRPGSRRQMVFEMAERVLSAILHDGRLRQATVADLRAARLERATSKTLHFELGEATVAFNGSSVYYSSGDNNHQRELARSYSPVHALLQALDRVQWTRGSGGVLLGNDEYNQDEDMECSGGGGSYITAAYGPLGESERASAMGVSVQRYREMHRGLARDSF